MFYTCSDWSGFNHQRSSSFLLLIVNKTVKDFWLLRRFRLFNHHYRGHAQCQKNSNEKKFFWAWNSPNKWITGPNHTSKELSIQEIFLYFLAVPSSLIWMAWSFKLPTPILVPPFPQFSTWGMFPFVWAVLIFFRKQFAKKSTVMIVVYHLIVRKWARRNFDQICISLTGFVVFCRNPWSVLWNAQGDHGL